jgi:hypothetical protein
MQHHRDLAPLSCATAMADTVKQLQNCKAAAEVSETANKATIICCLIDTRLHSPIEIPLAAAVRQE